MQPDMAGSSRLRISVVVAVIMASGLTTIVPSHALSAEAKWTSYLRAGPGQQFAVLDEIASNDPLTVQTCSGGWCKVLYGRADGYVLEALLDRGPPGPASAQPPATHDCFDDVLNGYEGHSHVQFCSK